MNGITQTAAVKENLHFSKRVNSAHWDWQTCCLLGAPNCGGSATHRDFQTGQPKIHLRQGHLSLQRKTISTSYEVAIRIYPQIRSLPGLHYRLG